MRFKKTADSINLTVPVLKCTNGKKITPKRLYRYVQEGYLDPKADITVVEFAIYMSHVRCWEQLLKSKSEYMVVFEDDVEIKGNFNIILKEILDQKFGVFFMANGNYIPAKNTRRRVSRIQEYPVYQQTEYHIAGASCYCIHRQFAEKLLEVRKGDRRIIKEPVDNFMGDYFMKNYPQLTFDSLEYDSKTNKRISSKTRAKSDNDWPYLDSPTVFTNRKIGNKIDISTNDWSLPSVGEIVEMYKSEK